MIPRIAITIGNIEKSESNAILALFTEPEILEIITPVIYGNVNNVREFVQHTEMRNMLNALATITDVCENRINVIEAQNDALARAIGDCRAHNIEAVVLPSYVKDTMNRVAKEFKAEEGEQELKPMALLANDELSLTIISENASTEEIVERGTALRNALRRDMRIDNPRIAIYGSAESIAEAVETLRKNGVVAFGPYTKETLFDNGEHAQFDGILSVGTNDATERYNGVFGCRYTKLYTGFPVAVLQQAQATPADNDIEDNFASTLRSAMYCAIDVQRSRYYYDLPLRNPLKKLYHERREDGDKARFAVKTERTKE